MLVNLWDYIKQFNIHAPEFRKGNRKWCRKKFFEEKMAESFQNLVENTEFSDPISLVNLRINTTPKHIIVKLLEAKRSLESRNNKTIHYKWQRIFNKKEDKAVDNGIISSIRKLSTQIFIFSKIYSLQWTHINTFLEKLKLREFVASRFAL